MYRLGFQLGTDQKIIKTVLSAYKTYTKITPIPKIGLVIDYEKGRLTDISEILSEIIILGGQVMFAKHPSSQNGIKQVKNAGTATLQLGSLSINLPRLAFESNKDETYFRARLALLMKPALSSMTLRKKDISDLIRLGINPILANNTQYMQRCSVSLVVNLIGLREVVFGILGFSNDKEGNAILCKVIETAVDVALKKGKELGVNVTICMTESDGSNRFFALDAEKYGKNTMHEYMEEESYSEGNILDAAEIPKLTIKNDKIIQCNKIAKLLNGGILTQLKIEKGHQNIRD